MFATVFVTVLSGTLVFTLGKIIEEWVIKPRLMYKSIVAKIIVAMHEYCHIYSNGGVRTVYSQEAYSDLRKLVGELEATYNTHTLKWVYILFKALPKRRDNMKVSDRLIYLANATSTQREPTDIQRAEEFIAKKLKFSYY